MLSSLRPDDNWWLRQYIYTTPRENYRITDEILTGVKLVGVRVNDYGTITETIMETIMAPIMNGDYGSSPLHNI